MKLNGSFLVLLLLTIGFILPSCSLSKRTAYNPNDNRSVEEYEEKIYGKQDKEDNQEILVEKKIENDTIIRKDEESIIMPDAVDVSNYEPEFKRKERLAREKKEREEKARELGEIAAPENPSIASSATIKEESQLRGQMVDFSKQYLGLPYKYGGKKPSTGFDCSGLTAHIYKNFGMQIGAASRYQAEDGIKIPINKTQEGDIILFGTKGTVSHVAMVVRNDEEGIFVIHSTSRGVVIDNILKSSYWKPKILFARKVIGE